MRRILLATTALVALSAAASPAFAFNIALISQPGNFNTQGTGQTAPGGSGNNGNIIDDLTNPNTY
ncbi:MAG TPA: hypothetical protein VHB19_12005, partial [Devosia sp.]|nr:hypothetical protein [Devosia sp.]